MVRLTVIGSEEYDPGRLWRDLKLSAQKKSLAS